jgi:peptidoglycan/xylan/chitin deacetylase (PgdA/CDA1 family)
MNPRDKHKLALKVDVDTFRGTSEGVPRLVEALQRHGAGATFLFSLGPDHTGRAMRRVFRKGFFSKVSRTSVVKHYGIKTLLYGTLLPGPDIGRVCAEALRAVRTAGFEVGIHCWDHVEWQDRVADADQGWTERQMLLALERFQSVYGEKAHAWGAAGWQTNAHALRLVDHVGLDYASDTRGQFPFLPAWGRERFRRPQLPTTLPTLDELIGLDGTHDGNVASHVLQISEMKKNHVFTAHAELEGGALLPAFEALLGGWQRQGYEVVSMKGLYDSLDVALLPCHEVTYGEIRGRSGTLALQGREVQL